MVSQVVTGEKKKKKEKKRCTWGGGVGAVTVIESFPARSEGCQNAEGPQDPLERWFVCKGGNWGLDGGGGLHEHKNKVICESSDSRNPFKKYFKYVLLLFEKRGRGINRDFCWYLLENKSGKIN